MITYPMRVAHLLSAAMADDEPFMRSLLIDVAEWEAEQRGLTIVGGCESEITINTMHAGADAEPIGCAAVMTVQVDGPVAFPWPPLLG